MKPLLFLILLSLCGQSTTRPAPKHVFRYNPKTGTCENGKKQKGYNPVNVEALFGVKLALAKSETFRPKKAYRHVDAECVDFRAFNFNTIMKFQYTNLEHWNLRGARLDDAKFFFARMNKADLRGAALKRLKFGYTTINGQIDKYTTYRDFHCQPEKNKNILHCRK